MLPPKYPNLETDWVIFNRKEQYNASLHQTVSEKYCISLDICGVAWVEQTFKGHQLQRDQIAQCPHPIWPWMLPGMGHLPALWASCVSPQCKNIFLIAPSCYGRSPSSGCWRSHHSQGGGLCHALRIPGCSFEQPLKWYLDEQSCAPGT